MRHNDYLCLRPDERGFQMNVKTVKFTDGERKEILADLEQEHPPHVYNLNSRKI